MTILLTWKYDALHPQANWCYLMVNECWLLNNKAFSQVKLSHTPLHTVAVSCARLTATCAHSHTCTLLAGGVRIRSGGLLFPPECTMKAQSATVSQTTSGPTPPSSSIYLWPVKNDISSWRASISICILLEAQRFRAEDISALSRQN